MHRMPLSPPRPAAVPRPSPGGATPLHVEVPA